MITYTLNQQIITNVWQADSSDDTFPEFDSFEWMLKSKNIVHVYYI